MANDTWTAPGDWATNEVVTAAKLNQQLRDNIYALWLAITSVSTAVVPDTVTRYVPLAGLVNYGATAFNDDLFPDTNNSTYRGGLRVPVDWVSGTDIVLKMYFVNIDVAGAVVGSFRSWIAAWSNAEDVTAGINNIESNVNVDTTVTRYIMTGITRTIAAAGIVAADNINWTIQRQPANAADDCTGTIYLQGAWAEYTAQP
ncbi:MAG: hypothetical protein A2064_12005 [Spirochaetes bacterium GWB1_66_5]|nr:MAG: hypothetical protein A2064_12005 [Spirochaetes bacterium GWB1_66_5]